jgi:hypothetical protein
MDIAPYPVFYPQEDIPSKDFGEMFMLGGDVLGRVYMSGRLTPDLAKKIMGVFDFPDALAEIISNFEPLIDSDQDTFRWAYWYTYIGFVRGVASVKQIPIRVGADWDGDYETRDQRFHDLPHIELRRV